MKNSVLRFALLLAASLVVPKLGLAQTNQPPTAPAAPAAPTKADQKPAAPTPTITGLAERAFPLTPEEKLVLSGADFQDGATVTLTDPSGKQTPLTSQQVRRLSGTQIEITANLDVEGNWKVSVQNPGAAPAVWSFTVAPPSSEDRAQSFAAYQNALIITRLLVGMLLVVAVALVVATFRGWSLGDAVSEESSVQPAVINSKKDVVMVASSSRLIALLGLLGILTIVLGVGYAVIWRLFVYGDIPDLSQVRNYLFGSACLFAPYLANQLREIFDTSGGAGKPDSGAAKEAAGTSVTGIAPTPPNANAAPQAVSLTGSGFQSGLSVTLTGPSGNQLTLTGGNVTFSSPTLATVTAALDQAGDWKAAVTNPGAGPSSDYRFTVVGPPAIAGVIPQNPAQGAAPVHNANPQALTFTGDGFMAGLMVQLTDPAQHAVQLTAPPDITSISPTRVVVRATLTDPGAWRAVIANPGGRASAPFGFNVT